MKKQLTLKLLKYTLGIVMFLNVLSCSDDNELFNTSDELNAITNSEEVIASKGASKAPAISFTSVVTFDNPVCAGIEHAITLSGWNGTQSVNLQIYDENLATWSSIDNLNGGVSSPQTINHTFAASGAYLLRYHVGGSAANGGTGGQVEFTVTVVDCNEDCIETEAETAYAGDGNGLAVRLSGNNAWWYYLDIGDGSVDVTENIWASQFNDIGDVTYDSGTKIITITFINDWFLETGNNESVKWYSYVSLPTNGRPTPGHAPNKGTSLSFATTSDRYYAIHLDVATCE